MTNYSITEATRMTGCTRGLIEKLIFNGKIEVCNGKIPKEYVEIIIQEKQTYISLLEYAKNHTSNMFNGEISKNRNKLLDTLEEQEYFGLEICYPDELLSGTPRDGIFFQRQDVKQLDLKLEKFFLIYGIEEKYKIDQIIKNTKGHTQSKKYLRKFFQETDIGITPATTEFVSLMLTAPDILTIDDETLQTLLTQLMPERTRDYIIKFCNYVRERHYVYYSAIFRRKKESIGLPAYSDEVYIALSNCFFNAEYICENRMIEKAMENHIYAEMWLYLTLFFTCGWRAIDICRGWKYPEIDRDPEKWGIYLGTLDADILEDKIPDTTYEQICQYSLKRIEISGQTPGKTAANDPSTLIAVITPELYTFYGLLILIGESHRLRNGEGHMQINRAPVYQNKVTIKSFFGETVYRILQGKNIQTRRLNKVYLQGVEEAARETGCGGLMASAVASYARNHTDMDTIKSYLHDHQLRNETADVVLYFMMQRGCFSFENYNLLIMAYPDAFRKLSVREQSEILALTEKPLELENKGSGIAAALSLQDAYIKGDEETVFNMLKAMFEISQNRGQGKDCGIYCLRRAQKQACVHPEYESCLASCCHDLVFTQYGYLPLLRILKKFNDKAMEGNKKAYVILYKILIPRYQNIINRIIKETQMDSLEKEGLKLMLKEALN